ncbi:uncharacterized protein CELE_F36H9.5 [Caenorhabditis elegans]|uniref:Transmembrane protein n=1 Tax=Caenorhabditis elegans TaxID=6239 RepID=O16621_CAEEL|nr:Transmembrane protein [Caenorhabditis elegans]CCD70644.1 Transmembrane protein [Caenorhabditis elegans]|eukprot:NP_503503.1 Uncharacterized protein CELE_F36H9.5 [Caenorhabditis elegans]
MPSHTFTVNTDEYRPAEWGEDSEDFCVKVPRTSRENQQLKYGHVEDDNVDIAYLDFPLLRASLIFTFISVTAFVAAVLAALPTNYTPLLDEELVDNSIIIWYGAKVYRCRTFFTYPKDGLLSILNLLELNVWGNVIFRLATCLTIAVRFFQSIVFRNLLINGFWREVPNPMFRWLCDLLPMLTLIETTALAMFSIITMHSDFKEINHFCKSTFAIVSVVNMCIPTIFHFVLSINSSKKAEASIVFVRAVCAVVFGYCAPQYFQFHIGWTKESLCHSYIPRHFAIMEYSLFLAYITFHLLSLLDLHHLQFICYPRSCSGECEPLAPVNFEKGEKYEHCRAFEYNQWRLKNTYK